MWYLIERQNEELRRLVGGTCDEDWVKKCMEYRVEGRRPSKTWLECVEADMADHEIDKDVHDRSK